MSRRQWWLLGLLLATGIGISMLHEAGLADDGPPSPGPRGEATLVTDPQNVVASELFGDWRFDLAMTKQVSGKGWYQPDQLSFRRSEPRAEKVLDVVAHMLPKIEEEEGPAAADALTRALQSVYAAGEFAVMDGAQTRTADFLLVSYRGNPRIFIYDREGGLTSRNLFVVPDPDGDADLLFVGGSDVDEPFTIFRRVRIASSEPLPDAVARGERIFRRYGCVACHSVDGSPEVGPTLKGVFGSMRQLTDGSQVEADTAYLKTSVLDHREQEVEGFGVRGPSFEGVITERELADLLTYLKSL